MTLRRLLQSLTADSSARAEFVSDPDSVLADAGLAGLGDELIGTALIHQADATSIDELDTLAPLLDRFVPIPGVVRVVDAAIPDDDVDADRLLDDLLDDLVADTAETTIHDDTGDGTTSDDLSDDISDDTGDHSPAPGDDLDGRPEAEPLPGSTAVDIDDAFGTGAIPITVATSLPPTEPGVPIEPEPVLDITELGVDQADSAVIGPSESTDVHDEPDDDELDEIDLPD